MPKVWMDMGEVAPDPLLCAEPCPATHLANDSYTGSNFAAAVAFAWNGRYELTAVSTNGTAAESCGYDALGRRAWFNEDGVTRWSVYDGFQVVAEVNAAGTLLRSYTWGPGIDNLLAFTDYGEDQTNTYYALSDRQGTVHALVDADGALVESYRYDAWGRVLGVYDASGAPIGNRNRQSTITTSGRAAGTPGLPRPPPTAPASITSARAGMARLQDAGSPKTPSAYPAG